MNVSQFSDFMLTETDDALNDTEWVPQIPRDGVIFLIDCSPTMLTTILDVEESNFVSNSFKQRQHNVAEMNTGLRQALYCCQTFMQNKSISSVDDLVGLALMRSVTSSSEDFKGINVLQPLDQPDARRILEIEKLRQMPPEEFAKEFASGSKEFPIHEALWACQNMFNKSPKALGYKRIFLVTDDPDPISSNLRLKRQAIAKASDLSQSGIELEVLPIRQEGIEFDYDLLYKDLQGDAMGNDNFPTQHLEELLYRVNACDLKRRRLARLPFYLIPSTPSTMDKPEACVAIAVSAYCLVRPASFPKAVRLAASTNALVTSRRRFYKVPKGEHPRRDQKSIASDPDNLVLSQDLVKGMVMGTRTVSFERSELFGQMKQFVPVGIHLLGFKPMKKLKSSYHLRTAQFIYPDEMAAEGSTLWFTTLLSVCLSKRVVGIALYVQRKGIAPRLVALVAQAEKRNNEDVQLAAPGFHVIYLPFADDFRHLDLPNFPQADLDQVEAAKAVIRSLMIPYDPEDVANPRLAKHYAALEALALERSSLEMVPDHTSPNLRAIKRRAGEHLEAFKAATGLDDFDLMKASSAKKTVNASLTIPEIREIAATSGGLAKLTVPILKQACALLSLKPSASSRKLDLIAAINDHLSK